VNTGGSVVGLKSPQIGDYVYFAPGAKVYGDIQIASRIEVAANAALGKFFLTSDKLIGGIPAKEITDIDIHKIIKTNK
jgi:serine O-acetyltransferase